MLKASKHEANLKMRSPLGSLETTTSIGGRCTGGNVLSRAVLITRKLSWRDSRSGACKCESVESVKDTACIDEKRDGVRLCSVERIAKGFVACSVPPMVFFMVKTAGTQANARCELKGKEI